MTFTLIWGASAAQPHRTVSCRVASRRIASRPIPSSVVRSRPILSRHVTSRPVPSRPIRSRHAAPRHVTSGKDWGMVWVCLLREPRRKTTCKMTLTHTLFEPSGLKRVKLLSRRSTHGHRHGHGHGHMVCVVRSLWLTEVTWPMLRYRLGGTRKHPGSRLHLSWGQHVLLLRWCSHLLHTGLESCIWKCFTWRKRSG